MEDYSGLEALDDDWMSEDEAIEQLTDFFRELSKGYIPALIANDKAIKKGEKEWETSIDNCIWRQKSFPYQSKCLNWINNEYNLLSETDKKKINVFFENTSCEKLILT